MAQKTKTLTPTFHPSQSPEPPQIQSLVDHLSLIPHIEGGYFAETDRDPTTIPNPFSPTTVASEVTLSLLEDHESHKTPGFDPSKRNLSTSIHFLITPKTPTAHFCRSRARAVHTLHKGRGRYVMVHENGEVESYVVGLDVEKGERVQWIVEGGVWKGSYLLSDDEDDGGEKVEVNGTGVTREREPKSGGLLISETVVPGFEYCDHEFLTSVRLRKLVGEEKAEELAWLCRDIGGKK
jgi:predicted cupin superfamily sugar epimerase